MELTKKDRLILINQYQILKRVDPDSAAQYERAIEILRKGYTLLYSEIGADLEDSELCADKAELVKDIAGAYQALAAYKSANPDDELVAEHPWASFRGFDAATEAEYLDFARFLLKDGEAAGAAPALPKYRMIALAWAGQGRPAEISRDIALSMLGLGTGMAPEAEASAESAASDEIEADTETASEAPAAPARSRKRSAAK